MRLHRIYYEFESKIGDNVSIEGDRAHYMRNVLRLKAGRKIRIFNHSRDEFLALISAINKRELVIQLLECIDTIPISKLNISLIQSLSKGERMDYTVQKATELGISTIQPITSEYCEVRLKGSRLEKKIKHWQNISISACEQSFRADIPQILSPISLSEYCQNQHQGILLEPEERNTIQSIAQFKWKNFDVVVGPEGGWSEEDLKQLKKTGLQGIQFGPRILRTETVAPAILASIHSLWGDFVI
ncbi:MAG: 16S rRNA (uracil(1498)-N(3))-methyltransferase [Marinicellaceae bacterium]